MDAGKNCAGIDDITDISGTDCIQDFSTAFRRFTQYAGTDSMLFQIFSRERGCFNIKTHIIETADQRKGFLFILICKCYDHSPVILHANAGSNHSFIHCPVKFPVISDGFSRRFHLR